jgi:hypothetical protein
VCIPADLPDHTILIRPGFCQFHSFSSSFFREAQPLQPAQPQPQLHVPCLRSLILLLIRKNTIAAKMSKSTIEAKFSPIQEIITLLPAVFLLSSLPLPAAR